MAKAKSELAEKVAVFYDRLVPYDPGKLEEGDGGDLNYHWGYWDSPEDDADLERAAERFTEVMIERIGVSAGDRVLDVGSGLGTPALRLNQATGASVVGVSISAEQVRRANERSAALGVADKVSFEHADAAELPFPADSFDAAWALESIIHVPDRARVLSEIARVVRPGGRIVLTDLFEREPIPAAKTAAVERFYTDLVLGPRVRLDDYPGLLRGAGLLLLELLDVSEKVLPRSFTLLSERVEKDRADLGELLGDNLFEQFAGAGINKIWEIGYLIAVAERPPLRG